jgi:hypothetical protein
VQGSNEKFFPLGSEMPTSHKRMDSLEKRKQFIINVLYKQCEERGEISGHKLEEFLNSN